MHCCYPRLTSSTVIMRHVRSLNVYITVIITTIITLVSDKGERRKKGVTFSLSTWIFQDQRRNKFNSTSCHTIPYIQRSIYSAMPFGWSTKDRNWHSVKFLLAVRCDQQPHKALAALQYSQICHATADFIPFAWVLEPFRAFWLDAKKIVFDCPLGHKARDRERERIQTKQTHCIEYRRIGGRKRKRVWRGGRGGRWKSNLLFRIAHWHCVACGAFLLSSHWP